jgi:hypothetical protein
VSAEDGGGVTVSVVERRIDPTDEAHVKVLHLELDVRTNATGEVYRVPLDSVLELSGRPRHARRVERDEQGQIVRIVDE